VEESFREAKRNAVNKRKIGARNGDKRKKRKEIEYKDRRELPVREEGKREMERKK
jgi:hypothetical protein